MVRTSPVLIVVCLGTALAGPLSTPACAKDKTYDPTIAPTNFVGLIDNLYLPLVPGTTFT